MEKYTDNPHIMENGINVPCNEDSNAAIKQNIIKNEKILNEPSIFSAPNELNKSTSQINTNLIIENVNRRAIKEDFQYTKEFNDTTYILNICNDLSQLNLLKLDYNNLEPIEFSNDSTLYSINNIISEIEMSNGYSNELNFILFISTCCLATLGKYFVKYNNKIEKSCLNFIVSKQYIYDNNIIIDASMQVFREFEKKIQTNFINENSNYEYEKAIYKKVLELSLHKRAKDILRTKIQSKSDLKNKIKEVANEINILEYNRTLPQIFNKSLNINDIACCLKDNKTIIHIDYNGSLLSEMVKWKNNDFDLLYSAYDGRNWLGDKSRYSILLSDHCLMLLSFINYEMLHILLKKSKLTNSGGCHRLLLLIDNQNKYYCIKNQQDISKNCIKNIQNMIYNIINSSYYSCAKEFYLSDDAKILLDYLLSNSSSFIQTDIPLIIEFRINYISLVIRMAIVLHIIQNIINNTQDQNIITLDEVKSSHVICEWIRDNIENVFNYEIGELNNNIINKVIKYLKNLCQSQTTNTSTITPREVKIYVRGVKDIPHAKRILDKLATLNYCRQALTTERNTPVYVLNPKLKNINLFEE